MDLLTNGIESIQIGVQDFGTGTRPRLLSSIRNIHAGILLLFKEALRRSSQANSNEALLKAKIVPVRDAQGNVTFMGEGTTTVDVRQIRERFEGLDIVTDWDRFGRINKVRNEIEHYYPTVSQETLKAVIADSFIIVRTFVTTELKGDPRELLGESTWQTMLKVSEVYAAERAECERLLGSIDWRSGVLEEAVLNLICPSCGSGLLRPEPTTGQYFEIQLKCRACGGTIEAEAFIPKAIEDALAFDMYRTKDGAELPYVNCPECGSLAYVIEEERCAFCGHEAEHICERCSNSIPPEELDTSPLCGWCAHMASKDD